MADAESAEQQEERAPRRRRAEATPPESSEQHAEEPRPDVPASQLIEDATALLGYPSWAAAGALRAHDPEEMMSIDAAKAEVEAWLDQPVEVAGQGED